MTFNDYRNHSVRRRQIILTLLLTAFAFANGVGMSDQSPTDEETVLELLAPWVPALAAGLTAALALHAVRVALSLASLRNVTLEMRTSPRFAWFGLESLILAVMFTAAGNMPLHMDFQTWLWLYTQPWMRLIDNIAFVGAPVVCLVIGSVALLRNRVWARLCGAIGIMAAAHALLERFAFTSLWEWIVWQVESLVFVFVGLPMSILYELTSGDPIIGSTAIIVALIATWLLARRRILQIVAFASGAHG